MNREIWRGWTVFVCAVAAVIASFVCAAQAAAQSTTTQVEIDLPSASTGSTGGTLAVRIFAPATSGRYSDGAPVVIYAPGGEDVGTLDESLRSATDVIRIVFLYPGGRDLRSLVRGSSGATWQAEVLWGIVRTANHGPGSDDNAYGVWRPRSSAEWTTHDPNGNLIAVGGGGRTLSGAESFAERLKTNAPGAPPVSSATIMVSPRTLTVAAGTDGIAAIETWAARLKTNSGVKWATISETAKAWVTAGGVASRTEP